MNEELELALAYWRTMTPQPKAIVYINAIEAKLKGVETKEIVVDHELENAIRRGVSIARAKGIKPAGSVASKAEEQSTAKDDKPKGGKGRRAKAGEA